MDKIDGYLAKLDEIAPNSYRGHLLRAVQHFVKREIGKAISVIRKCKDISGGDVTWRYSYAFLLAYRNDLQQAIQQYKLAFAGSCQDHIVAETEEFMLWVLDQEPDKFQLHFCLGYINSEAKDDDILALEEYGAFLAHSNVAEKRFKLARGIAEQKTTVLRKRASELH